MHPSDGRVVLLVGVSHGEQDDCHSNLRRVEFEGYLVSGIVSVRADCVAEEYMPGVTKESIAERVACQMQLSYRCIEPDDESMARAGCLTQAELEQKLIDSICLNTTQEEHQEMRDELVEQRIPCRERLWLENILQIGANWTTLFMVCGERHTESFSRVLLEAGIAPASLVPRWFTTAA